MNNRTLLNIDKKLKVSSFHYKTDLISIDNIQTSVFSRISLQMFRMLIDWMSTNCCLVFTGMLKFQENIKY